MKITKSLILLAHFNQLIQKLKKDDSYFIVELIVI
jgi:hypothetical protein